MAVANRVAWKRIKALVPCLIVKRESNTLRKLRKPSNVPEFNFLLFLYTSDDFYKHTSRLSLKRNIVTASPLPQIVSLSSNVSALDT